jgi:hypothetical protein
LRHPDLDPLTQGILLSVAAMLAGVVVLRGTALFRKQHTLVSGYPEEWTSAQTKVFQQVRTSIGVALGITWMILEVAAPRMPQSWPFGFAEVVLTIGLLLLTNAWLLLLMPSKWENSAVGKVSFGATMGILVWWWTTFLGALILAIMMAVAPAPVNFPLGSYAQNAPRGGAVDGALSVMMPTHAAKRCGSAA